jgi:Carboxypeptidase regulatory-like domain
MTHNYAEGNNSGRGQSMRFALLALLLLSVCSLAGRSWGQGQGSSTGTITGTVTDSSGAVIPNAAVTVTNVGTNAAVQTATNQTGDFTVPYLVPAHYKVLVRASGFETGQVQNILLTVGQTVRANVTLKPGASNQTISVTANTISLDTDSSSVGQVISEQQIEDLPMENREDLDLLLLAPGSMDTIMDNGADNISANDNVNISGARSDSNGYFIDGLVNNEAYYTLTIDDLSLDAIQEFKEQGATYSAEYGETPAQVNITTKSGTNQVHGTAFEFVRNNDFDAVSAFTPAGPVPPLKQNDYGYSFAGPVYIPKVYNGHNRSFFFANYERLKLNGSGVYYGVAPTSNLLSDPAAIPSTVPVLNPSTGAPFAQDPNGNYLIPSSDWSRLAVESVAIANQVFLPVNLTGNPAFNSDAVISSPTVDNQQTYRIDQKIGLKDSIMGRFTLTHDYNTGPNAGGSSGGFDPLAINTSATNTQTWVVSATHTFNDHLINNAMIGRANFNTGVSGPYVTSAEESALGMMNIFTSAASYPDIQWANGDFANFGGSLGPPEGRSSLLWQGADSLYWIRGRHNLALGVLVIKDNSAANGLEELLGTLEFDGTYTAPAGVTPTAGNTWADFLLGDIVSGQAVIPTYWGDLHPSNPPYYINEIKFAAYVNDDFKVSRNFSLNLGIRYDFQGLPDVEHALWGSLIVPGGEACTTDAQYAASGLGGSLIQLCTRGTTSKTPFAPRVGFEYSPVARTVVRGGYGVFFDQFQHHEFDSNENYPWNETASTGGYNFDQLFPAQTPQANPTELAGLYNAEPPTVKNEYYQDWSLGVEQQLRENMKLNVAYVGGMGTHLLTRMAANQPYGYSATDTPAERMARYPYYNLGTYGLNGTPFSPAYLDQGQFVGASNYNALQASLEHRAKNMALLASFTWASSMDDASSSLGSGLSNNGWQGPMDSHDIHLDYAKSSFDVNKRLVLSCVYMLPFGRGQHFASGINRAADTIIGGWQLDGIYTAQGGIPFNAAAADLGSALQADAQRPNQIASPYPSGFHKTAAEWFNTAAYVQPPEGVFGDETRDNMRAPGVNDFDASILKNFTLLEEHPLKFQLRGEAFNAPNHVILGGPGQSVGNSSFGVISGVQIPGRIIQVAGKFIF